MKSTKEGEPVLLDWKVIPKRPGEPYEKLLLKINGRWYDKDDKTVKVPLPLPLKSKIAINLICYLHLPWIRKEPDTKVATNLKYLYKELEIESGKWSFRALTRALEIVNKHIKSFDADALATHGIKIPERYEMKVVDDGRAVRFLEVPRTGQKVVPIKSTNFWDKKPTNSLKSLGERFRWRRQ